MKTRSGKYPIGFRVGGSVWQKDLSNLLGWAKTNGLEVIDLGTNCDHSVEKAITAGFRVGSVDLLEGQNMISADKGVRAEAIARNIDYIHNCAVAGPLNHFLAMLPKDPTISRSENFSYMVDSFSQLVPVLEANAARLVIEGWPGPGALCCTPEGYRAFFRECRSPVMGINYDASHLIRMGIDYLRFLKEFADRVYNVHGKDTEILTENQYYYGYEQSATFTKPILYGGYSWRYCIPGHGVSQWKQILGLLVENNYAGSISIELEDENFSGGAQEEQFGILQGARFLSGC